MDAVKVKYMPAPTDVTLRYIAGEYGQVRKEGSEELLSILELSTPSGTMGAKVTAVPDEGYVFDQWSDGKTTSMRQDDETITVKALFKRAPKAIYTVGYKAKEHGTLNGITYQFVLAGEKGLPVNAVAEVGYKFLQWSDGLRMNPRTDIVTEDGKIYEAEFTEVLPIYVLTYIAGEHGEVQGVLQQEVERGASGSEVEALPDDGYRFVQWSDGNKNAKRIDANVQESKTYTASFEKIPAINTFMVTLTVEGQGELSIKDHTAEQLQAVPAGTELTAVATPATGWKLKSLTAGDKDIASDGKFTVTADVEVKAIFEKATPVEDAVFATVLVSPNPFDNQLRITNDELRGEYALLNSTGVVVASGVLENAETRINTSLLPAGMYLLRLSTESGATKTYRVVKQ